MMEGEKTKIFSPFLFIRRLKYMNNQENIDKNWDGRYRILKKEYNRLSKNFTVNNILKCAFIILFIISSALLVNATLLNKELIKENNYLHEENMKLISASNMYFDTALYFADMAASMDETNATLKEMVSIQEEELVAYRSREELLDKYEYALYYGGKKTDITYGQIISLQEYCEEKGYSNEMVDLVLAIAMKESTGNSQAYNKSSGATGYGQFLNSTAKFVYTKLQGNENYTHDAALDGETNLKMVADYMDYLTDYYGGSVPKAMDSYRGCHDKGYIAIINKYLGYNGLSLDTIRITKEE